MSRFLDKINLGLLMTGNELLGGKITEKNMAFLTREFGMLGIRLAWVLVLPDQSDLIATELTRLASQTDVIIITGGLGSTGDDATRKAAAQAAGLELEQNQIALEHLKNRFGKQKTAPGSPLLTQALFPQGAKPLPNSIGSALGFEMEIEKALCYFSPGVPSEFKDVFVQGIKPSLIARFGPATAPQTKSLCLMGPGEMQIEGYLHSVCPDQIKQDLFFGFKAGSPFLEVKADPLSLAAQSWLDHDWQQAIEPLAPYVYSEEEPDFYANLIQLAIQNKQRFSLAESCTGGLLSASLTRIPGASAVLIQSVVTYSNQAKARLLGIDETMIKIKGAVSESVASAMAEGALKTTGADFGVGITGIAGPTGGSAEKPVGTVFIAIASTERTWTRRFLIQRARVRFQTYVTATAADQLRRAMLGLDLKDAFYAFDSLSVKPDFLDIRAKPLSEQTSDQTD